MAQTINIEEHVWYVPLNDTIALQAARIAELEAKLETAEIALRKIQQTINEIGKIDLVLRQAGL